MKLESISIQNLRCLIDSQSISLRPLTLVVGANSSGKSTFVRMFPLLRQSVETVTKGPILWFGPFVDFGVFKDAVSKNSARGEIEFGFTVTVPGQELQPSMRRYVPYYHYGLQTLNEITVGVKLVVAEHEENSNTYTKQITINCADQTVQLNAAADGTVQTVLLNGQPIKSSVSELTIKSGASLFSVAVSTKATAKTDEHSWGEAMGAAAFPDLLFQHIDPLFQAKSRVEEKAQFAFLLGLGNKADFSAQMARLAKACKVPASRIKTLQTDDEWINKLRELTFADRIPQLLNYIDSFLAATFRSVSYVGPLRAIAERFYRQQDLAVDEVDPTGANLAMFLMGLNQTQQQKFSDWCEENIGFAIEARPIGAHVSIRLRDSSDGEVFNIADMGFGYSQLLPVLATMWQSLPGSSTSVRPQRIPRRWTVGNQGGEDGPPKFIVIEQPELHLHPRLQGRLADLLCAMSKQEASKGTKVHLICETHSETIVNEIGKLVSEKKVDSNKIQVLVFEKKDGQGGTLIRQADYDKDGILNNWPYGFFLPSED